VRTVILAGAGETATTYALAEGAAPASVSAETPATAPTWRAVARVGVTVPSDDARRIGRRNHASRCGRADP
jgi:hypothetical protein